MLYIRVVCIYVVCLLVRIQGVGLILAAGFWLLQTFFRISL